jgi:cell division protein FtsN
MARDYAQRGNNRRQTRGGGRASSGLPAWVWAIAGLSAGLVVAAGVYISRPTGDGTHNGAIIEAPPAPHVDPVERKRHDPPVPIPPKEKERFTFYELLPNQEVVVPKESLKSPPAAAAPGATKTPAAAPTPASEAGTYFIQVASYKSREEADRQKAALALLGVESKVESVTIDGKETYYRVRVGPEHDFNRVQLLLSRLEDNGVPALLVKVK